MKRSSKSGFPNLKAKLLGGLGNLTAKFTYFLLLYIFGKILEHLSKFLLRKSRTADILVFIYKIIVLVLAHSLRKTPLKVFNLS